MAFGRSPDDSIEYEAMEGADHVAVVPVEMGWSDIGSWGALHELAVKHLDGNAHHGKFLLRAHSV
jgi:mannose-1-phosphate guanylyltransferase